MNTQQQSSSSQPIFARPGLTQRLIFAFVAIVASAALLGGELSLFEMQASDAALAHAQTPASPASSTLAAGKVRAAKRG